MKALFLVGPTASGKTEVAHQLAAADNRAVLSADSMLVYRGMDIGTAKPPHADLARYRYRGVDLVNPDADFSTGQYLDAVKEQFRKKPEDAAPLIVCGGTGLYVRCLLLGMDHAVPANPGLRTACETLLEEQGITALQNRLRELDAERYAALDDPDNPRRLVRAIEQAAAGVPLRNTHQQQTLPWICGLRMERALLLKRIELRAQRMFDEGLLEEAAGLRQRYPALSKSARQAIGYREAYAVLDGEMFLSEAIEQTVIRTRKLAKRQMTWFRHQARVQWVDVDENMATEDVVVRVKECWKNHGSAEIKI
jgi:tRNA dimethylallyltransferase